MTEEEKQEEGRVSRIQIAPHPLGGIQVQIRDMEGELHNTRVDLQEACIVSSHLNALTTMMFQQMYMEAAMAAEQAQQGGIIVPGGKK